MQTPAVTRTIAGHRLTLDSGARYVAARPMAEGARRRRAYPVSIYRLRGTPNDLSHPVLTLPAMTYDEANDFLAAFNDGETSFEGRVW